MKLFVENEKEAVMRNIEFLMSSYRNSICFYRDFGMMVKFLDKPNPFQEIEVRSEIVDAIDKYEPRVSVDNIDFRYEKSKVVIVLTLEYDGEIINVEFN